jgi:hypothetical protein
MTPAAEKTFKVNSITNVWYNSTSINEIIPNTDESWEKYRIRRPKTFISLLAVLCLGLFASNVVQQVFFKRMADDIPTAPYFLLVVCSVMFVIIFGFGMFVRWIVDMVKLKRSQPNIALQHLIGVRFPRTTTGHGWLMAIGFADSINGMILIFSAAKTPAMLHPILQQAVLYTFVASYLLRTRRLHLVTFGLDSLSTFITTAGIAVSLIPFFQTIAGDPSSINTAAAWPLVFLAGVIPGAVMNVIQEKGTAKLKNKSDFDYLHLLTWVSIYQVVTDLLLFWSNFVNPASNIHNLADLGRAFDKGFACLAKYDIRVNGTVVGNCQHAALDTTAFLGGYVGTYVFSAFVINLSSSILTAITNAPVVPAVTLVFFLLGTDKVTWHIGIAVPLMLVGAVVQLFSDKYRDKRFLESELQEDEEERLIH